MSEPASISSGIAQRYAAAVFDLAQESSAVDALEADVAALTEAVSVSDDLRDVISSPLYSREDQTAAMSVLAAKLGLGEVMANTLSLMASKRRLFVVPQLLSALKDMIADAKGEMTADVVAAKALTKTQIDKLSQALKSAFDSDVKINATVDESLIGGLIVKVGSQMIDTTVRARLNALQNTMKEVG